MIPIRFKNLPPGFAQSASKPRQKPATATKPRKRAKTRPDAQNPPEREIQAAVVQWLLLFCPGSWVVRVNGGAVKVGKRFVRFTNQPGCPDLLMCYRGLFLGIEIKSEKGRLRPSQAGCLDSIRAAGGYGFVVRSVLDLEKALRLEGLI